MSIRIACATIDYPMIHFRHLELPELADPMSWDLYLFQPSVDQFKNFHSQ
jgi:hypothetical protein